MHAYKYNRHVVNRRCLALYSEPSPISVLTRLK